jgi:hypothetical protein
VYIAGQDGSEDRTEIFFIRSTNNGGSFGAPISINNNHEASILGNIIADGNNVYLVWSDLSLFDTKSVEVFFRRSTDNGASFRDIVNLSNNAGYSIDPKMKVIESNVYVVWRGIHLEVLEHLKTSYLVEVQIVEQALALPKI